MMEEQTKAIGKVKGTGHTKTAGQIRTATTSIMKKGGEYPSLTPMVNITATKETQSEDISQNTSTQLTPFGKKMPVPLDSRFFYRLKK
jgi:hypothetical protein